MSAATRSRFAEVVRARPLDLGLACLLVGGEVQPDLDVDGALAGLDALAASARPYVPVGSTPAAAAAGLRVALGERAGFGGSGEDYGDVRSSLLHEVLLRRRGLPLTLSVVWVEVARRLGVAASPVALPGHVVVALGDRIIDPFSGGTVLDVEDLGARVRAATGGPLRPEHLRPADPVDLLLRLLTNVRVLAARQDPALEATRTRLWAVELSLLLPRHPAELRRERGELLVRLGDYPGGARELEAYAEVVEDADPGAAEQAARAARLSRSRLN